MARPEVTGRAPPVGMHTYVIGDAMRLSGLSRSSLYKLMQTGELESVKRAGRRLIVGDSLRKLLRPEQREAA